MLGGSLNLGGDLLVRADNDGGGGALARLVSAVERAARQRPPIQKTADRLANVQASQAAESAACASRAGRKRCTVCSMQPYGKTSR